MLKKLTVFLLAIFGSQPVFATEFFCSASAGNITCLFDAMFEANFNGQPNTIFLDNGTYTGLVLPSVAGPFPLTIVGQDAEHTVIDGSRDFGAVFFVAPEGNLTLNGLTIRGSGGGGIRNLGTLNISDLRVNSNINLGSGGGIFNAGTATISKSSITNNVSDIGGFGGGMANSGTANITNTTISDNHTFDDSGGGIYNPGVMTITDSTVVNNTAGGVITSGNGILNSGELQIVNSTIARNSRIPGEVRGGGIDNLGTLKITNSTITENRGASGGIFNAGIVELQNTILAGNASAGSIVFDQGPDCVGSLISLGNNLIGDPTGCDIALQETDVTGDPGLREYTEDVSVPGSGHYPLLPDSPAIDLGNSEVCPETDQLENQRSRVCDIGAIEFQGGGTTLVSIDIRPQGEANRINPNSTKEIRVAVLTDIEFDATTVDPNSVRFGATGTEAGPVNFALRDVEADGDTDLVLRFEIQDTGIQCGQTSASLTGATSTGLPFTGSNFIKTVRCGRR
jgi:hypothetical protein